jgi:hypothetical protein
MAYVYGTSAITINFIDDDGAKSGVKISLPPVTEGLGTEAMGGVYALAIEELVGLVAPLSDSAFTGATLTVSLYDDTFPEPDAGSDVEDKGVFICRTADNSSSSMAVPGILESLLIDTGATAGVEVDLAETDVANFVTALIDGFDVSTVASGTVTVEPCDSRGFDLSALVEAYKQNRRSQKSRRLRG